MHYQSLTADQCLYRACLVLQPAVCTTQNYGGLVVKNGFLPLQGGDACPSRARELEDWVGI